MFLHFSLFPESRESLVPDDDFEKDFDLPFGNSQCRASYHKAFTLSIKTEQLVFQP